MFDFEKLEVYLKAKAFSQTIFQYLKSNKKIDAVIRDQLRRASLSVMLNIAEGSSRFSKPDKRHFYVIARGSVFESIAILEFLCDAEILERNQYGQWYKDGEEISKILFTMIKNLD
jgi:four helix bundle protein